MNLLNQELRRKIKCLNELLWGRIAKTPVIDRWLSNFEEDSSTGQEETYALYMLSSFMYFGNREMRALLRTLFNELFKSRIKSRIRRRNGDTVDSAIIDAEYQQELNNTRFVGIGDASESGNYLSYQFKQENNLHTDLFMYEGQIIDEIIIQKTIGKRVVTNVKKQLHNPVVRRYVFLDDLCGSGRQGCDYLEAITRELKNLDPDIELWYWVPFGTPEGLEIIKSGTSFDQVEALSELDESYRCFSNTSRYFGEHHLDREYAKKMSEKYGKLIYSLTNPLGNGNGQLLIGFHHNVPDNTFPIIWTDGHAEDTFSSIPWHPIFLRYQKK